MNIVLIGATGGIGSEILKQLHGANNFFIGSNKSNLKKYCEEYSCFGSHLDVTEIENFNDFFEEAVENLGSIDVIINCVGSILLKPSHLASEDEILETFKLNTFNSIATIKYGFKHMRKLGGSIVLFSSSAASIGLRNHDIISSSKGAIDSLVKSAAMTYSSNNIRINAVAPGLVDTNLSKKITENPLSLKYSIGMHPIGRIGKPSDVVGCVKWLIDPSSDWVTGQVIAVDGGLGSLK